MQCYCLDWKWSRNPNVFKNSKKSLTLVCKYVPYLHLTSFYDYHVVHFSLYMQPRFEDRRCILYNPGCLPKVVSSSPWSARIYVPIFNLSCVLLFHEVIQLLLVVPPSLVQPFVKVIEDRLLDGFHVQPGRADRDGREIDIPHWLGCILDIFCCWRY